MATNNAQLEYGAPGHKELNERLLAKRKSSAAPDVVSGPWMSNEAVTRLPPVRNEFEQNRDPNRAPQLRDMQKTEAERREEQSGRGSTMIKRDQPKAILKPPEETRAAVDNEQFRKRWLSEQRNAAMVQSSSVSQSVSVLPEVSPEFKAPEM